MKKKNLFKVRCQKCGTTFWIRRRNFNFPMGLFPYQDGKPTVVESGAGNGIWCPFCKIGDLEFTSYIKRPEQKENK